MKILVTGADGFIGKNLIERLAYLNDIQVFKFNKHSTIDDLEIFVRDCDFIFHLAGVNRPKEENEYLEVNLGLTSILLELMKKQKTNSPIMFSSSVQATLNNSYGKSKKACEELLFKYSEETGGEVIIYRFENVFGKWSRPNYNSVIATFAHNIAHDLPITINDPNVNLRLIYIDDVINELINALNGTPNIRGHFAFVEPVHLVKLGCVAQLLYSFKDNQTKLIPPNLDYPFVKKLYSTYLSYLPKID